MKKYDEKDFEGLIESHLLENGYKRLETKDYDKDLCVDKQILLNFLQRTQKDELDELKKRVGQGFENELFSRLDKAINENGLSAVLKRGFKASGIELFIAFAKPSDSKNPKTLALYKQNECFVARQVHYSKVNENSLDMVIFLNGVAVFSIELKNKFTGQSVQDAINQYKFDRNENEKIFKSNRLIAHFAVDNDEVFVCTTLRGKKSEFLPFNRGLNDGSGEFWLKTGAGNPAIEGKMKSSYFWEQILEKDTLLNILFNFVQEKGGEKRVIFPRYHQFDLINKLIKECVEKGVGQKFLVQHSAGSGKSNSISYLAHQLTGLRDLEGKLIFDSVIVVTDRRVLDSQINDNVQGFAHTKGVVEHVESSKNLRQALENGKKIIISTIQKFPFVVEQIQSLKNKNFAIIIDEAHSSQSGASAAKMGEAISKDIESYEDMQERILRAIRARKLQENASYFAFTATPKQTTLEMFGQKCEYGGEEKFIPFHLYSMKQAIQEGFILDVLENYTTYKSYYKIIKTISENPRYDKKKAKAEIHRYVEGDERTIAKKVEVMVGHFLKNTQHKINAKAKAMIVTSSRQNALKYYFAFNEALRLRNLQNSHKALIAFSGEINDGGEIYTEAKLNGFDENALPKEFKKDENRFLIVAEKYQTGFDEPLLHTMYVDKKLSGINAVQTLSRLNRICVDKFDTCVLDFANDTQDIARAFSRFYAATYLKEASDVNQIFDLRDSLLGFGLYSEDEAMEFLRAVIRNDNANVLHSRLENAVFEFKALEQEQKEKFYQKARDFIKIYGFLGLILPFEDENLEANFVWLRYLLDKLPFTKERLSKEFLQSIDLRLYRLEKKSSQKIQLEEDGQTPNITTPPPPPSNNEEEALDKIVQEINEKFSNVEWGDNDKLKMGFKQLRDEILNDKDFKRSVINTDEQTTKRSVERTLKGKLVSIYDTHEVFYEQLTKDSTFKEFIIEKIFGEWIREKMVS